MQFSKRTYTAWIANILLRTFRTFTIFVLLCDFRCSTIVNRFLELDLDTVDIKPFFMEFVIPTIESEQ